MVNGLNVRAELIDAVDALHRAIDDNARVLSTAHATRLNCKRGCSGCCSDGLTVFEVEAAAIVRRHRELLDEGTPHPAGRCAFLDDQGGCRIYEQRPYVCRTQGLPIRWIEGDRELRDICTLNVAGPPLESLDSRQCWPIGPVEARLSALQHLAGGDGRVALRDLFRKR